MRHLFVCLLLLLSPFAMASQADLIKQANFPARLTDQTPALERKGQGVFTYMWADVYVAALYGEPGTPALQSFNELRPQRLEIYYLRDIDSDDVVDAATETLQRQLDKTTLARLQKGLDQLNASIQDIVPGDRYSLIYQPQKGLTMERNGKVVFNSPDAELARAYFGLWLTPDGLSKKLRETLLGEG